MHTLVCSSRQSSRDQSLAVDAFGLKSLAGLASADFDSELFDSLEPSESEPSEFELPLAPPFFFLP
jgi:hypothetical protein